MANSLDDFMRLVKEAVYEAMELEVCYKAKEVVSKHVKKDVYSYKTKHPTNRRMDSGGMSDEGNVNVTVKRNGKGCDMEVEDKATGRNGFSGLSEVTEYGTGGNWNGIVPPRPFIENSAKELEEEAVKALKKGLKSQGFNVE